MNTPECMRSAVLMLTLAGLFPLGGCAWLNSVVSDSEPSPAAPGESVAARTSLLPLLSPEGERRLMEAKSLWVEDDCQNPEYAALLLDTVLDEAPHHVDALIWRGKALTAQGYLEDAFDDLTEAVQLLSGMDSSRSGELRARAYAGRAYAALRMAQTQGAERDLASALEADPAEPSQYLYRSALAFLQSNDAEGCAELARACEYGMCGAQERAKAEGLCR